MTDTGRLITIPPRDRYELHMHVSGMYGDCGENEGVLSVNARLEASPNYPERGLIIVGSPTTSPLLEGYIPKLGGFSCSPDAAEQLIAALQQAVAAVRAVRSGDVGAAPNCEITAATGAVIDAADRAGLDAVVTVTLTGADGSVATVERRSDKNLKRQHH